MIKYVEQASGATFSFFVLSLPILIPKTSAQFDSVLHLACKSLSDRNFGELKRWTKNAHVFETKELLSTNQADGLLLHFFSIFFARYNTMMGTSTRGNGTMLANDMGSVC